MLNVRLMIGIILLGFVIGCSQSDRPPLGRVSGKVTMDGAPIEGLIVNFRPDEGRTATSETNAQGKYDLIYTYQVKGAKVGPSTVSFVWPTGAERKKGIPAQFSEKSEIKFEVKSGSNIFDYNIRSK